MRLLDAQEKLKRIRSSKPRVFPTGLQSLLGDSPFSENWNEKLEGGYYLDAALTSSMYHRFHAPCDVQLRHVTYISGDTLECKLNCLGSVEQLFCKNENCYVLADSGSS